jgi:hypothetical protein
MKSLIQLLDRNGHRDNHFRLYVMVYLSHNFVQLGVIGLAPGEMTISVASETLALHAGCVAEWLPIPQSSSVVEATSIIQRSRCPLDIELSQSPYCITHADVLTQPGNDHLTLPCKYMTVFCPRPTSYLSCRKTARALLLNYYRVTINPMMQTMWQSLYLNNNSHHLESFQILFLRYNSSSLN